MREIKVSIITVCYNSEKTIERTIKSVLNQTYKNIEYIIIDGKSSDATIDMIKKYESEFGNRMKWVSEKDDGIYYAMNKGIDLATGELIGIINSDDFYEEDAVEKIVEAYGEEEYQIIYGMVRQLRNSVEDCVSIYSHHFLRDRMICHPGCFVSKNIYEKYGGFNTEYISAADYDFMLRMNQHQDVVFKPVYSIISNFEQGGVSSSKKGRLDKLRLEYNWGKITKKRYLLSKGRIMLGI